MNIWMDGWLGFWRYSFQFACIIPLVDGGEKILPPDQSRMIEQAKFTYSTLGEALQKQIKTIKRKAEKQVKGIVEHGR